MKGNEGQLIAARAAGKTLKEVARLTGMSVRTVQRRLGDPDIAGQIIEARGRVTEMELSAMRLLRGEALDRLAKLLHSDNERNALHAIAITLRESAHSDLIDYAAQLTQLRDQILDILSAEHLEWDEQG